METSEYLADPGGRPKDGGRSAVIITGMHRSGTSLVASLLQRGGVDIGEDLLGPHESNPHGHFEDLEFLQFHRGCLQRLDVGMLRSERVPVDALLESECERARELVEDRRDKVLWGWKDPRTVLFLDLWRGLLPGARYVFVYRHPVAVVLSLLRRATDLEVLLEPRTALDAWKRYNMAILDFYDRFSQRCVLFDIDAVSRRPAAFLATLRETMALPLAEREVGDLVHLEDLRDHHVCPLVDQALNLVDPTSMEVLRELRARTEGLPSHSSSADHTPANRRAVLEGLVAWLRATPPHGELVPALLLMLLAILEPAAVAVRRYLLEEEIRSLRAHVENLEELLEQGTRRRTEDQRD